SRPPLRCPAFAAPAMLCAFVRGSCALCCPTRCPLSACPGVKACVALPLTAGRSQAQPGPRKRPYKAKRHESHLVPSVKPIELPARVVGAGCRRGELRALTKPPTRYGCEPKHPAAQENHRARFWIRNRRRLGQGRRGIAAHRPVIGGVV